MWLLWICLAVLFVYAIAFTVSAFRLHNMVLCPGTWNEVLPADIPEEAVDRLIAAERFLSQQGFRRHSHLTRSRTINSLPWGLYGALYTHEQTGTWGLVYVEPMENPVFDWRLILLSELPDGTLQATQAGLELGPAESPGKYRELNIDTADHGEQLAFHFRQQPSVEGCRLVDYDQLISALEWIFFSGLVSSGKVKPVTGGYRFPLWQCYKVVYRVTRIQQKLGKKRDRSAASSVQPTVAHQLGSYQSFKALASSRKSGWLGKTALLLVSVALFSLAFGLAFSWDYVLVLLVVLFIHESGHLLGMWMFGYKDLRMLFVPFMGALAVGRKEHINSWQEAVMLLLGPLPGYVAGLAILQGVFGSVPQWLTAGAVVAVILNLINLFPLMPLDGGRLVNLALFNRAPMAQLGLLAISAVLLFLSWVAWDEYAGLVICVFLVIGSLHTWREARLMRHLLKNQLHRASVSAENVIANLIDHPVWQKMPPQNRWLMLDSLLDRLQHANTSVVGSAGIFALWLGALVLPPLAFMDEQGRAVAFNVVSHLGRSGSDTEPLERDFEQADTDADKLTAAIQLSMAMAYQDREKGRQYVSVAEQLLAAGELTDSERGNGYSQLRSTCYGYHIGEEEIQRCERDCLLKARDFYEAADDLSLGRLEVLTSLSRLQQPLQRPGSEAERLAALDEAGDVLDRGDFEHGEYWQSSIYALRASVYEESGDLAQADYWLRENLTSPASEFPHLRISHLRTLVEFYQRHKQSEKAVALLRDGVMAGDFDVTPENGTTYLAMSPRYWLVWLTYQQDFAEAAGYLSGITNPGPVGQVELALAGLTLERLNGQPPTADDLARLQTLAARVEQDYNWGELVFALGLLNVDGEEEELLTPGPVSAGWYQEMRKTLDSPALVAFHQQLAGYAENLESLGYD